MCLCRPLLQVHLGNGVFIDKERWDLLQLNGRDCLFCKESAKLVSQGLCWRFLKDGNAVEKPALSPRKLVAVGSKYYSHSFRFVCVMFVRIYVLH